MSRILCVVSDNSDDIRGWVRAICDFTGLTLTALARDAGVASTTLTRFMNDEKTNHTLSARTLTKIGAVAGLAPLEWPAKSNRGGTGDIDAIDLVNGGLGKRPDAVQRVIDALTVDTNSVQPLVLKTRALEQIGCLPGDILFVDAATQAQAGDLVRAEISDAAGRKKRTVIRIFESPYLLSASAEERFRRPIYIDNDSVQITGVVVHFHRSMLPAA